MNILAKCLRNTQKKVRALKKQQDVIYKQTLLALETSDDRSWVFDYLFNGQGSPESVLQHVKEENTENE